MRRNSINFLYNPGHMTLWCFEVVPVFYARVASVLQWDWALCNWRAEFEGAAADCACLAAVWPTVNEKPPNDAHCMPGRASIHPPTDSIHWLSSHPQSSDQSHITQVKSSGLSKLWKYQQDMTSDEVGSSSTIVFLANIVWEYTYIRLFWLIRAVDNKSAKRYISH